MARALSQVYTTIRGSVGGVTYLAGPHHAIIARARVAPVQPISLFKTAAKNALVTAAGVWKRLTALEQLDWDNYALTVIRQGATGSYNVTGRLLMMGARQLQQYVTNRALASPTMLDTAPLTEGMLLPSGIGIVPPPGPAQVGFGVTITADPGDDTLALIDISKAFDKERHFWKGPWDTSKSQAVVIPADTTVETIFVALTVGRFYFIRVKCVGDDAGPKLSAEFFLRGQAVASIP
ncbi:MAG: hypothetical protein KAJ55_03805 [Anaerolineales bacterium]|nr:hypothetical protein [Anaerolineales bacterium]